MPLDPGPTQTRREAVLVIPREDLFAEHRGRAPLGRDAHLYGPQGLVLFAPETCATELDALRRKVRESARFVDREAAEQDPSLKQLIPYCLVAGRSRRATREPDDDDGLRVLCLRRSRSGGDPRLQGKWSIGVGGHLEPVDAQAGRDPLEAGALRELHEELVLPAPVLPAPVLPASVLPATTPVPVPVGWINDDSNSVGSVHLGVVAVVWLADIDAVAVRETDRLHGELRSPSELRAARAAGDDFESWSALLLDRLEAALALASGPARRREAPTGQPGVQLRPPVPTYDVGATA
jgi:predicted NUDIX family phosphoesterase